MTAPSRAEIAPCGELYVTANSTNLIWCNSAGTNTSTASTAIPSNFPDGTIWEGTLVAYTSSSTTPLVGGYYSAGGTYIVHSNRQVLSQEVLERQRREAARLREAAEKRARGAIKRALKLMDGIGFGKDIRIFLSGSEIEVSHPNSLLKFVIQKGTARLIDKTCYPGYSTPYELALYTKGDVHVADLCVYMKNTPMLDQVLALSMFIKSGNEEMILRQANWRSLTSDMETREILALEYPRLEEKFQRDSQASVVITDGYIQASTARSKFMSEEDYGNNERTAAT